MAQRHRARVTSADVARAAGVSRATVSYVINEAPSESISEDTRQRVLAAAERLGYTPYGPARTLASGRSDVVLMVMPNWPFGHRISMLLDSLDAQFAEHGLALIIHRLTRVGERASDVWKVIGPAAVIGMQAFTDEEASAIRRAGIVVAMAALEGQSTSGEPGVVIRPQASYGATQVRHLAAGGHRRIGYAYPADDRVVAYARLRLEGVRSACRDLGLPAPEVRTLEPDAALAADSIDSWLAGGDPVTAVACYNDEHALAVLAGLRLRALDAPKDLAVIGVDDDPAGRLSIPSLTTVDRDWRAFTTYLASFVTASLNGTELPARYEPQDAVVIVRASAP